MENTRTLSATAIGGGACEASEPLEAFRTVIVLNGSDGFGAAKAARVARLDAHDAAGHFLDGTR